MTRDEQLIKAALDMAAATAVATPESRSGAPREWSDGFTSGCLHSADAIRAITPTDVLAKVGPESTYVRPLEWDEWAGDRWIAFYAGMSYTIRHYPGSARPYWLDIEGRLPSLSDDDFPDLAAAKSAAQADHERRVLDALTVTPQPADPIEHADCWMLLWDMPRRAGISDAVLAAAIREQMQALSGHTPGPWRRVRYVDYCDPSVAVEADHETIAPQLFLSDETDTNARLIAAPPDMRATIFTLCDVVDAQSAEIDRLRAALVDLGEAYRACNGEDHPAYIAARAALSQKEGG